MLEQFLMKYGWAGTGMVVIAIPILTSNKGNSSSAVKGAGDARVRQSFHLCAKSILSSERGLNSVQKVHNNHVRHLLLLQEGFGFLGLIPTTDEKQSLYSFTSALRRQERKTEA